MRGTALLSAGEGHFFAGSGDGGGLEKWEGGSGDLPQLLIVACLASFQWQLRLRPDGLCQPSCPRDHMYKAYFRAGSRTLEPDHLGLNPRLPLCILYPWILCVLWFLS